MYEEKNVVYYLHQYCKGRGFEFHSCLSCVLYNCNDQLCLYIEYSLGKKSETKQNDCLSSNNQWNGVKSFRGSIIPNVHVYY